MDSSEISASSSSSSSSKNTGSISHAPLSGYGSSLARQVKNFPSPSIEKQEQQQQSHQQSKKKKLKSEKSAVRSKDKGVWLCRHCGWEYSNPRPSAKERREHRRHCSSLQSAHEKVHDWLEKSPAGEIEEHGSDEAEGYEDGLLHVEEATVKQPGATVAGKSAMVVEENPDDGAQNQNRFQEKGGTAMEIGPQKGKQSTSEQDPKEHVGDLEKSRQESRGAEEWSELEGKENNAGDPKQDAVQEESQQNGSQIMDKSVKDVDEKETDFLRKGEEQKNEKQPAASSSEGNLQQDAEEHRGKKLEDSPGKEQDQDKSSRKQEGTLENTSDKLEKTLDENGRPRIDHLQEKNEAENSRKQEGTLENGSDKLEKPSDENGRSAMNQLLNSQERKEAERPYQTAYYPEEKALVASEDNGEDLVTPAGSEQRAEQRLIQLQEPQADGQTMKQRIEYVEPQYTASSSEIKPLEENPFDYDVRKLLREQRTYDLVCPNCYSCITRRVILRKRKRTAPPPAESREVEQQQQQEPKQPKTGDEPLQVFTGVEGSRQEGQEVEIETEEWQCLACFSVFFTKVRGIRFPKFRGSKKTKLEVTEITEESITEDGCSIIPFLLPDYAWDGDGTQVSRQPPVAQTGSSCLPLRFPWSTEGSGIVEQNEMSNSQGVSNCTPFLLPDFSWEGDGRPTSQDSTPVEQRPLDQSDSSCLPLKLPWKKEESTTVVADQGEGEIQNIEIFIDLRKKKPHETTLSWIGKYLISSNQGPTSTQTLPSHPETSAPTAGVGQVHPSSEAEGPSTREETRSHFSCAPILLPAYWNDAEEQEEGQERINCLPEVFPDYYGSAQARGPGAQGTRKWTLWDDNSNCLPMLFTESKEIEKPAEVITDGAGKPAEITPDESPSQPVEPQQVSTEQKDRSSCNCIPAVLPFYGWGPPEEGKKASSEENAEPKETTEKDNNCLPVTLPSYSWRDSKNEHDIEAGTEKRYVTTETRIRGFINTITNLITVRQTQGGPPAVVDSVPVDNKTSFVDVSIKDRPDPLGGNRTEVLTSTPSTGWAVFDEGENEEESKPLIDSRRPRRPSSEITEEEPSKVDGDKHTEQVGIDTLVTIGEKHQVLQLPTSKPPSVPIAEVQGDEIKGIVNTALSLGKVVTPAQPEAGQSLEILKSIVYGGVDVSLASLAVVASGAGGDVKTLNLVAMALANIFAGFMALLHTIGSLWLNDRCAFEERIGKRFWLNGGISVVSFLFFGFVAPLVYAFSFRSSDDNDNKFAATVVASLVCIVLLALAKARVQNRSYRITVLNMLLTSFVAAVSGFFVGDFLKRWLQKLGLDIGGEAPAPAPAPPPPFPFADI